MCVSAVAAVTASVALAGAMDLPPAIFAPGSTILFQGDSIAVNYVSVLPYVEEK